MILLLRACVVLRASSPVPPNIEGRVACAGFVIAIGISVSNRCVQVSRIQGWNLLNAFVVLRVLLIRVSALERGRPYFVY